MKLSNLNIHLIHAKWVVILTATLNIRYPLAFKTVNWIHIFALFFQLIYFVSIHEDIKAECIFWSMQAAFVTVENTVAGVWNVHITKNTLILMAKKFIRHKPRSFIDAYFTYSEQKVAKYCKKKFTM